jgi:outer membrane protein OmpA-like peptidoglycan-associated protein
VYVTADAIVITEKVYFDSGRSTIKRVSHGLLDDVAAVLVQYPGISKVEVQGHTDNRGNDDYNMKLSDDRAKAVKDYLVAAGVEEGRLAGKGYGETTPVEDNNTSAGRAKNRRVAFVILEQQKRVIEKDITDVEEGEEFEPVEGEDSAAPAEGAEE